MKMEMSDFQEHSRNIYKMLLELEEVGRSMKDTATVAIVLHLRNDFEKLSSELLWRIFEDEKPKIQKALGIRKKVKRK